MTGISFLRAPTTYSEVTGGRTFPDSDLTVSAACFYETAVIRFLIVQEQIGQPVFNPFSPVMQYQHIRTFAHLKMKTGLPKFQKPGKSESEGKYGNTALCTGPGRDRDISVSERHAAYVGGGILGDVL